MDFQTRLSQSVGDLIDRQRSAREEHALPTLPLSCDRLHKSSGSILPRDQVGTHPHRFEAGCGLRTDGSDPGRPEEAGVETLTFQLTHESLDPVERREHHPIVVRTGTREIRLEILDADKRRIDHVCPETSKLRNHLSARGRWSSHDHVATDQRPEARSRRINVESGQPSARTHDQHHGSP